MIVLKYTRIKPESKETKEIEFEYAYDVIEDENQTYNDVCEELKKKYDKEPTDIRRVEVIEFGFVIHKSSIHPRNITK